MKNTLELIEDRIQFCEKFTQSLLTSNINGLEFYCKQREFETSLTCWKLLEKVCVHNMDIGDQIFYLLDETIFKFIRFNKKEINDHVKFKNILEEIKNKFKIATTLDLIFLEDTLNDDITIK